MVVTIARWSIRGVMCLALALLAAARPAAALESAAVTSAHDTVTLISDTDAIAPGTPFRIALRIRLAPGWHTYWRNPGDAGVAPQVKFILAPGATAGPIDWPVPRRLAEGSLITYAYTGNVVLPITITLGSSTGPVEAQADWLVCKDICVPEQGRFRLNLPAGKPAPSAQAPLFRQADMARPTDFAGQARIAPDGRLWVGEDALQAASAWFIPGTPGVIDNAAPQHLSVRDGGFVLALTPASGFRPDAGLEGILLVTDRSGRQQAFDLHATPGPVPAGRLPLGRVLGLAFLGGLILNLMPCVFPVLAMKAIRLADGHARGRARSLALSYLLGVLVAFGGLGGAVVAARAGGAVAGWGFQFQSPAFVAGMAWLLLAVGLNLSGVFQVGSRLAGVGQGLAGLGGHAGSFFTGLLAVVVATPCTAPFMATALAAAATAPADVAVLVFLTMGVGLATPYMMLAEVPGLVRVLPRPGRWMEVLRQVLAFPMYAAAAWLVWVISQEAGPAGVLATLAGIVLIGFAGWVLGATQAAASVTTQRVGQAVTAATALVAVTVLTSMAAAPAAPVLASGGVGAEPFTVARLAALRAEGRPVFVDMTAAWCVTCLVNERVALDAPAVRHAFVSRGVIYLKGDWTRQDPGITGFLRAHGRDGVPLYVYFPPDQARGIVLPQVLTETAVLRELKAHG
jgi:thiol:disulfide interchange protein/DsbC/DsbD-like thiol-disulfide interchange protein